MKRYIFAIALALFALTACDDDQQRPYVEPDPPIVPVDFAKGADIGWLTQWENSGVKFYDAGGNQMEGMALMKSLGMDALRFRVWVNPSGTNAWCGKADVVNKCKRAHALGMRIMIDFHYSDSWADPEKQNKPAAWRSLDFEGLKQAVADHTKDVLQAIKDEGIDVAWVQVGNETSGGMLWEDGRATNSNMANYAALHNAGYYAAKEVYPNTKVIVHINNGYDQNLFHWIIGGLYNNGAKFDIIGMSLYPAYSGMNWQDTLANCIANMESMWATFRTPSMIVEVGYQWNDAATAKAYLSAMITQTRALKDYKCQGVFYWEPMSNPAWQNYALGAFAANGRPTEALDAFAL